jgi:hypothetical protein
MKTETKNKTLLIWIAVLLITNMILLLLYLQANNCMKQNRHVSRQEYVKNYLAEELLFDASQLARYNKIAGAHRIEMMKLIDSISLLRKPVFQDLAISGFTPEAIQNAALKINTQQRAIELEMLRQLVEIRSLCNGEQLKRFDTSFYKITSRKFGAKGKPVK